MMVGARGAVLSILILPALLAAAGWHPAAHPQAPARTATPISASGAAPSAGFAAEVARELRGASLSGAARAVSTAERRIVEAAYASQGWSPLWVEADAPHRVSARAIEAIELLRAAADKGLRAVDYDVERLAARAKERPTGEAVARFEAALSLAFGRYLMDLGFGRIDPASLGFEIPRVRRRDALPRIIASTLASGDSPTRAAASVEPRLTIYRRLLEQLARYRELARPPALPLLSLPKGRVSSGDSLPTVAALREHLIRHGDLVVDPAVSWPDGVYDEATADGLRRFQKRHGLDVDGVFGPGTREALAVPITRRVRQIEWSLERLRWLGETPTGRYVAINIPEYRLWAVSEAGETDGARASPLTMPIIVGTQVNSTPVFVDAIEAVEVNPYWNVPTSIGSKELYPKLARDAGYLARQDMELIGGAGLSGAALQSALASGAARIRQKPGAKNALGKIKFVMPNRHSVYLHDTPSRQLFDRSRRDFSHGCIRLKEPLALAEFVLRGRSGWDIARVREAIEEGRYRSIPLSQPVPVLILYSTVNVDGNGRAHFFRDVYGLDAKLERALAAITSG